MYEEYDRKRVYDRTITNLNEVQWIQCPIQKLEHIYQTLKYDLASEIDEYYLSMNKKVQTHFQSIAKNDRQLSSFANSVDINKKERVIDIDNLQGICIYIVYAMKYAHIISEFFLINDFISKNVQLSSRSIFLNVIKGGIDYLLNNIEKELNQIDTRS